jgi:hypothetical protein
MDEPEQAAAVQPERQRLQRGTQHRRLKTHVFLDAEAGKAGGPGRASADGQGGPGQSVTVVVERARGLGEGRQCYQQTIRSIAMARRSWKASRVVTSCLIPMDVLIRV